MMNIVNMLTLLKEINGSRGKGAALIARLRGCGLDVLLGNWGIPIFVTKSEQRERERDGWRDVRFGEVGGYLKKKSSPRGKHTFFVAVQKALWVVLAVSCLEVAYLRTERQWWIHNTDICLTLLSSTSPWQLNWQADTDTEYRRGFLMLPAHWRHVNQLNPFRTLANIHSRQAFMPVWGRYLKTYQQW